MRSQARAKVGNKGGNPGYRSAYSFRLKELAKVQSIKANFTPPRSAAGCGGRKKT